MDNSEIYSMIQHHLSGGKGTRSGASKNPWLVFAANYRKTHGNAPLSVISAHYKGVSVAKIPKKKKLSKARLAKIHKLSMSMPSRPSAVYKSKPSKHYGLKYLRHEAKLAGYKLSHIVNGKRKQLNKKQLMDLVYSHSISSL